MCLWLVDIKQYRLKPIFSVKYSKTQFLTLLCCTNRPCFKHGLVTLASASRLLVKTYAAKIATIAFIAHLNKSKTCKHVLSLWSYMYNDWPHISTDLWIITIIRTSRRRYKLHAQTV